MKTKSILLVGITGILAGCAASHPCIHGKGGVCLNARTMYGITNDRDQVNPDKTTLKEDAEARKLLRSAPTKADETPNLHPNSAPESSGDPVAPVSSSADAAPGDPPGGLMAPLQYPKPLITQPKVLRVWVAPYRGPEGNLHFPGMVYSIIRPQTWSMGAQAQQVPVPVE